MVATGGTGLPSSPGDVTRLLHEWAGGDARAFDRLFPLVYGELRARARTAMSHERDRLTLQPTALVHEAYLKLVGQRGITWKDRAHFYAVASRAMREVLVESARRRNARKRGGALAIVVLGSGAPEPAAPDRGLDLLALDVALERLARLDERQARLAELRLFGGLTVDESAEILGCSPSTVKRDWQHAEAWLRSQVGPPP